MGRFADIFKCAVAVVFLMVGYSLPVLAQEADIDQLLSDLSDPKTENWQLVERQLRTAWSKSGSASMDLLLQRGEKALEDEDYDLALEHLTALTDHAPEFAEGWNAQATAFFHQKMSGPAMEDVGRALALNPKHFGAMTGLAVILQDVGMRREALEVWRMVEAVHPHRPEMIEAIDALEALVGGQRL